MTARERFICVISSQPLKTADAIVLLEGDYLNRVPEAARLYKEGWAPLVVISGGLDNPPRSVTASRLLPHVVEQGVPRDAILLEETSRHTREQADEVVGLARSRAWRRIILVASHYHQYRAFLTFFRALKAAGLERQVEIISAPVRLPWFAGKASGEDVRIALLDDEFEKISQYGRQEDLGGFEDALSYVAAWEGA